MTVAAPSLLRLHTAAPAPLGPDALGLFSLTEYVARAALILSRS